MYLRGTDLLKLSGRLWPGLIASCTGNQPHILVYPKQLRLSGNRSMHTAHTEHNPGVPVSADQEGTHYWDPQDTFYTKSLFKDQEIIGDLPNT